MQGDASQTLTRTGPGTPMGELIRRYWIPALLSAEIAEPDGGQVRVGLLGEKLLAFRDSEGRPGLIDEFCRHRGVSLMFGRNEECGVRCAYHGWKFDIDGQCVDLPSQPELIGRSEVAIKAYPCVERGGIIWAYMGPPDKMPALPEMEWATVPESYRYASKRVQECNYLQAMEGGIDTTHVGYVHRFELDNDPLHHKAVSKKYIKADPKVLFTIKDTPSGLTIFGRRNGEPGSWYWRITQWICPFYTLVPPTGPHPLAAHAWVPIDDENCWSWNINFYPFQALSAEEIELMEAGSGIHAALVPGTQRAVANRANNYLLDRQSQKERRTYSGVAGLGMQDSSLQESMGAIQDRSREFLVQSDRAIVLARRKLLQAVEGMQRGEAPPALDPVVQRVRSGSVLLEKGADVEVWSREALVSGPERPLYDL